MKRLVIVKQPLNKYQKRKIRARARLKIEAERSPAAAEVRAMDDHLRAIMRSS